MAISSAYAAYEYLAPRGKSYCFVEKSEAHVLVFFKATGKYLMLVFVFEQADFELSSGVKSQ